MPQDPDELAAWLRLDLIPGVGPETARKLLRAFGLPENIFAASHAELMRVVPERVARALLAPPSDQDRARIECSLEWAQQASNSILTLADPAYPQAVLEIADPPSILYAKGRLDLLARPALAVVGSRNATAQGAANAGRFAEALCRAGLTIVSGLALGIDAAAHQGALRCGRDGASTVAVIGTGADLVYPARNRSLAHRIAGEGCLLSEYALGTPAIAANFPRRNRLISGLARGVLVVEAAAQSGSLITARMAAEQGREVFAIPGSIHSPLAKGCHRLIKQGAKLVESAQDILEELKCVPHDAAHHVTAGPDDGDPVLAALGFDPVGGDILAQRTGLDAAALNARLLTLELEGRVERLAGGQYRRLD